MNYLTSEAHNSVILSLLPNNSHSQVTAMCMALTFS